MSILLSRGVYSNSEIKSLFHLVVSGISTWGLLSNVLCAPARSLGHDPNLGC